LSGKLTSLSFSAAGLGGEISGSFSGAEIPLGEAPKPVPGLPKPAPDAPDFEATVAVHDVNLAQIPDLEGLMKLPMTGNWRAHLEPLLAKGKIAGIAKGEITLGCKSCTIGDGKAKVAIPGNAFLATGVTVPKINIGSPEGKLTVDKGVA